MERILDNDGLSRLGSMIDNAGKVFVCSHVSPDGDAIGSALSLKHILARRGKSVSVAVPNIFPDFLQWMPGARDILIYAKNRDDVEKAAKEADLIIVADLNDPARMTEMAGCVVESTAPKVMIDHHLNPVDFCDLVISQPSMCATAEVLCHLYHQFGLLGQLTVDEAACLYVAMMCDTGAFTYNSNRPVVYECISRLLERGIDKDAIYRKVFWTWSVARLRLTGYMLYVKLETLRDCHAAILSLTNAERKRFGIKNGDTEGLVNMPLQLSGVSMSVFLSEDTEHEGVVKVSLRSVGSVRCDRIANEYFNGGGHMNASGGRLYCSMDEALEFTRQTLRKNSAMLKMSNT